MFSGLATIEVDFNDIDDDHYLTVWREYALVGRHAPIRKGATINLWDAESGGCLALVRRVRGNRLDLAVDWETWTPAPMVDVEFISPVTTTR